MMTIEQEYVETVREYQNYLERTNNGRDANCGDEFRIDCADYERELDRLSRTFSKAKVRRLRQKAEYTNV